MACLVHLFAHLGLCIPCGRNVGLMWLHFQAFELGVISVILPWEKFTGFFDSVSETGITLEHNDLLEECVITIS